MLHWRLLITHKPLSFHTRELVMYVSQKSHRMRVSVSAGTIPIRTSSPVVLKTMWLKLDWDVACGIDMCGALVYWLSMYKHKGLPLDICVTYITCDSDTLSLASSNLPWYQFRAKLLRVQGGSTGGDVGVWVPGKVGPIASHGCRNLALGFMVRVRVRVYG